MRLQDIPELIYSSKEKKYNNWERTHYGASLLGTSCLRRSWLDFRKAKAEKISGQKLRLFERGDIEEPRIANELKKIPGIEVIYKKNARSYGHFQDGHFSGTLDILSRGWEDNELGLTKEDWVNTEVKTFKSTRWNRWVKEGIVRSDYQYYVQAQSYMGYKNLKFTVIIGVNKDTDEIHIEIIKFYLMDFNNLKKVAQETIHGSIPVRTFSDASYVNRFGDGCKNCKFCGLCWYGEKPDVNCRTCQFIEPLKDGTWRCNKKNKILKSQKKACSDYKAINLE